MPSGGLNPVDQETARRIYGYAKHAAKLGLLYEWLMFFTGGVRDGVDPIEAANAACLEWDM